MNRTSKLFLSPAGEIASREPSLRHQTALHAIGHCRGKEASWTDKLAQIGQGTTCISFWKVDQRGGSPDAIERLQVKGKVTEIGENQRQ